jgi:transposase
VRQTASKILDTVTAESSLPAPRHRSTEPSPEKDALIGALTAKLVLADERIAAQDAHIAAQNARISALEARLSQLTRPTKTPGNSSKPPSQGQKQDLPAPSADRPPRKSHPGVGRTLHPYPDRTIDRLLTTCPKCEAVFPDASQTPQQVYERIELPPVRPDVTQVRLFGGRCACCGERVTAKAPAGLEQGSPFGHSIAAMVVYLHYAHAIGMERLALLMDELFSLSISEGAISNILARAREPLLGATAAIEKVVLASPVVCSFVGFPELHPLQSPLQGRVRAISARIPERGLLDGAGRDARGPTPSDPRRRPLSVCDHCYQGRC